MSSSFFKKHKVRNDGIDVSFLFFITFMIKKNPTNMCENTKKLVFL